MIIEIIVLALVIAIFFFQHQMHNNRNVTRDEEPEPVHVAIPRPLTVQSLPVVSAKKASQNETNLNVTPVWFEPIKKVPKHKIKLPTNFKAQEPSVVRTHDCLSMYRSMVNKNKPIDFVAEPFVPSIDSTETTVVILNELVNQLGGELRFTEKSFKYDDSDYRTACGVSNIGSFHSILNGGQSLQAAMFKLHMGLDYDQITSSQENIRDFTITLINDLSKTAGIDKEFIRVCNISRTSSIHVEFHISTPDLATTKKAAEKCEKTLNNKSKIKNLGILRTVIDEDYNYQLKPVVTHLQLQMSDFKPRYNRAYLNAKVSQRGGHPYYLPQGWYRHALKVVDKYPNSDVWLGMNNSPGEWRVAYHGTKSGVVKSIAHTGLQHEFVTTDACKSDAESKNPSIPKVKGLYVATHCEGGASRYSEEFKIMDASGHSKTYRVAFQCRVENGKYTEHEGPVKVGLALRVYDEKAIRPYGILLKET